MGLEIKSIHKLPDIKKQKLFIEIILCILCGVSVSLLINKFLLPYYFTEVHTILELLGGLIVLSAFLTFWNTSRYNTNLNYILTFGFMLVAAFDVFYAYFFYEQRFFSADFNDTILKFYFLGSIIGVFILLFGIKYLKKKYINKSLGFVLLFIIVMAAAFLIFRFHEALPWVESSVSGIVKLRVYWEYAIILCYLYILYKLSFEIGQNKFSMYRNLFISLSLEIPTEFLYTQINFNTPLLFVCWHILGLTSYIYFYKGIFDGAVTYPYKEIERIMSEDKIKGAFDYVNIGVAITDLNANIISVNKHLCKMLGYTENELLRTKFKDITFEGDKYTDEKIIANLFKNNTPLISFEKRYVHKSGYQVWVRVTDTFVYDNNNRPLYVVTEIQDISSRKKILELEEKIEKDKKTLEETIELDKLRTEFFANLSHELRTPLNVIIGASQLTEFYIDQNGPNSLDHVLKNNKSIKQNSRRLLRLVNNLIDTTKIDSGFFQLKLMNYNIISLIEDITLSVAGYTNAKGIDLIFDTDIEEKIIACDPDKIERIILNLLSNAIKFTDAGGSINVYISCKEEDVIISVQDTGIGIPKDKQSLIFERFRQVDKSFTRNQEGSGIGLSLVKSLVELHDGKIDLLSIEGRGSEFIITLPVRIIPEDERYILPYAALDRVERVQVEFSDIYTYD